MADSALARLSPTCERMYAHVGRASVPPEQLLKASLLIALYSVCSELAFCEELECNLPCCWFLDMDLIERSFKPRSSPRTDSGCWRTTRSGPVRRGGMAGRCGGAAGGRTLQRGWDSDRGRDQPQEFPVQGETAACGRLSVQPQRGLPGEAPVQPNPRQHPRIPRRACCARARRPGQSSWAMT